jgi:hypothetical protein
MSTPYNTEVVINLLPNSSSAKPTKCARCEGVIESPYVYWVKAHGTLCPPCFDEIEEELE